MALLYRRINCLLDCGCLQLKNIFVLNVFVVDFNVPVTRSQKHISKKFYIGNYLIFK